MIVHKQRFYDTHQRLAVFLEQASYPGEAHSKDTVTQRMARRYFDAMTNMASDAKTFLFYLMIGRQRIGFIAGKEGLEVEVVDFTTIEKFAGSLNGA
jgi:hypothetical protein